MERHYRGSVIIPVALCITFLLLSITIPFPVHAFEPDLEKELQQSLIQSRAVINRAEKKMKDSLPLDNEIIKLKEVAESVKITNALMQERFRLRREQVNSLGAKAQERHRVMEEGYLKALEEYLALMEGLQRDNGQPAALSHQIKTLKTLHDKILPKKKRPIFGNLPYKNLNYPAREPNASPVIKPAYKGGNKVVSPEDTKDTPEAPLSIEIATLAQSLNWNPVSIYEYLKNNIETEWYWGCMKGAEETLRQKSGNDCDQATLLTALLRSSGFPTRYVRGVIEFPNLGHVKNLTGIDAAAKIADFFQKTGIPHKSIISAGTISNFQIEHVWIESLIPYSNYRGAIIDEHGKTWLGLDTSIKVTGYTYNAPMDMFEQSAISNQLSAIRDEYLNTMQTKTPIEYLKEKLSALSDQLTADSYKLTRSLIPEVMNILPASMQYDQKVVTHEYTEIPDELKHKVKLSAFSSQLSANADSLFDITIDTLELSNRQIALSYEPETVEDQQIIDSYGGLDNTPAYLVRLRPVLKVNDERAVVGKDGLPMGSDYDLTIELISPNGIERITNTHITGNLAAIGITAQRVTPSISPLSQEGASSAPSPLEGEGGGEGDKDAEQILYEEAINYIDRWNQAEDELASLMHLSITRPIPTVVTVGGVIDVTYLLDMPHGFEWKGVFIDASLRAVSPITHNASPITAERQKTFMQLSGLQGSILENRIFEDDLQVESISTAKLMQVANSRQIPILTLDKANIGSTSLPFDAGIVDDLKNAANQNLLAKIPNQEMTYFDWTGTGYTKEDLQTNESGYMLSGMIAGGMTTVSPDKWPNQKLVDILGKPYAGQYTTVSITSPKNESILYTSPITVSGIALDPNAGVTVNGIEAYREGNTFTATGIQLTRGINRIIATATNSEGVSVSNSIIVKYRILLRTFITFPYEGANLSVQSIDVEGIVSDPAAAIEVNGITAIVSTDGRFIASNIALSEGSNQITVRATNAEGEVDLQTLTVTRQAAQAETIQLTITEPTGNGTINRPSVLVKGAVTTTADEVWIKVNGVLAEVYNGQFVANHVPLTEGNNVIVVNATDSNGGVGRAEVSVTAVKGPYVTLNANITSGIASLAVHFSVSTAIPNPVALYQMDLDGDGVIDFAGTDFDNVSLTYTTEGIYYPKVMVTDAMGNVYTDTMAITVLNKAKIDAILKGKWEKVNLALMSGDVEGVLEYFTLKSKERYGIIFNALKDQMPVILGTFVEFNLINVYDIIAEYELLSNENGKRYSYPVVFMKGGHGIWKIKNY